VTAQNNPNYSPFKTLNDYEQDRENHSQSDQLCHRSHPRRSWRSHDDVGTAEMYQELTNAMENQKGFKISQYACAVLLIVSSIVMVAYQVVHIDDVAGGLLYYVAQSFLLAGSIFGLDQYLRIINKHYHENNNE